MMHLIGTSIKIGLNRMGEKFFLLLVVLALAVGCSAVVAQLGEEYFTQGDFKLSIALVILDDSENMNDLARLVLTTGELRRNYNILQPDSQEEGLALVESGAVYACIVLPEGFFTSLQTGQNYPPQIILNATETVDAKIATALVDALVDMMRLTQSGIYYATDLVIADQSMDGSFFLDSNFAYLNYVLARSDSFQSTALPYESVLDLGQHYALTMAIYLLLLATPLFYDSLNRRRNFPLMKQLSLVSHGHHVLYFIQVFMIALLYFGILLAGLSILGGTLSPIVVLSLASASLLLVLVQSLLLQLIPQYMSAIFLNFILHTAGLVVVGGVVPTLLLPPVLSQLAIFSPIYHIRTLMSSGLVNLSQLEVYNLKILSFCILLVILLYLINETAVRKGDSRDLS